MDCGTFFVFLANKFSPSIDQILDPPLLLIRDNM